MCRPMIFPRFLLLSTGGLLLALGSGCGESSLETPTSGRLPLVRVHSSTYILDLEEGGVLVSGHDPDYHAVVGFNAPGAINFLRRAVEYVAEDELETEDDLDLLLVTDLRNPLGDESDSRLGLAAAGFTFDIADHGSGEEGALDLRDVELDDYDVIVVASDYGGWLRQDELDILNQRSDDVLAYINDGGGLVVLCESGDRTADSLAVYTGTSGDRYGFLPFLVSEVRHRQSEVGFTLTDFGREIGLTESDINNNYSHVYFAETGGMETVDLDAEGRIVSAATRRPMTDDGVVLDVPLDIKPTSCPNPLNVRSGGELPVAVLGTDDLDVTAIDLDTIELLGVRPDRWSYADVATPSLPITGKKTRTDCNELGADGRRDLVLHFEKEAVVAAIAVYLGREATDREELILTLTARLLDAAGGNQIQGEDVVWILD